MNYIISFILCFAPIVSFSQSLQKAKLVLSEPISKDLYIGNYQWVMVADNSFSYPGAISPDGLKKVWEYFNSKAAILKSEKIKSSVDQYFPEDVDTEDYKALHKALQSADGWVNIVLLCRNRVGFEYKLILSLTDEDYYVGLVILD